MKRYLPLIAFTAFFLFFTDKAQAQTNQSVVNGSATTAVTFAGAGCIYNWVNSNPSIGLAANGTGDIASFTAVNNTTSPIIATITATPMARTGMAYIANYNDSVSVINTTTNTVKATIAAGTQPWGIAVSPDASRVYVTNSGDNTVSVINTSNNQVVATVTVGAGPHGIAVSPDGTLVYVANTGTSYTASGPNSVSVISTATNKVTATIPVGVDPVAIAVSPDGSRVYVANELSNTISVINTKTDGVVANITITSTPWGLSVSPDGSKVYVANSGSNSVSVINTATNKVTATIPVGNNPNGVTISPDGSKVYVTNAASGNLSVINSTTNAVTATVELDNNPCGASVSPDGSLVYVADYGSKNVSVLNTTTNTRVTTVPMGTPSYSIGNFVTAPTVCNSLPVTFTITVYPSPAASTTLVIPNTFTPNNDGINDTWNIKNLENYPNSTVEIFNREGEKLFYAVNYPVAWNGKYNGSDLPAGTYYYLINLKNGSTPISGWVAIIR